MPTIGSFSQDDLFGQEGILETRTLKTNNEPAQYPQKTTDRNTDLVPISSAVR